MSPFKLRLTGSTLVEVLVTMTVSGLLILAVYDGLDTLSSGIERLDGADDYERLDWLEHYEILEFRSDSVRQYKNINVFYVGGEPIDTLLSYGF